MYESALFLGFKIDSPYSHELAALQPELLQLFIGSHSEYLEDMTYAHERYLGKFVANPSDLQALELTKSHIYSLLRKLVPSYPYEQTEISLIPLIVPGTHS